MRWRKGQYLLFNNCVGKITKINQQKIHIRKYSKRMYSYQNNMTIGNLDRLFSRKKVRIISPEDVMKGLTHRFKSIMPITNLYNINL